jgi:hypothetical protein
MGVSVSSENFQYMSQELHTYWDMKEKCERTPLVFAITTD